MNQKRIPVARWVIQGDWKASSPLAVGGSEGFLVDSPVMRSADGGFMMTGEGIAGALRSYLNDCLEGYRQAESDVAKRLLGYETTNSNSETLVGQSRLVVFDSIAQGHKSEIRDGIRRDPATGVVQDRFKFDFEVAPMHSVFPLRFELEVLQAQTHTEGELVGALLILLKGLQHGQIRFGRYKTRGLGCGSVERWQAKRFDLTTEKGWRAWAQTDLLRPLASESFHTNIQTALQVFCPGLSFPSKDKRNKVEFHLELQQVGGLLIAGGDGDQDRNPLMSNNEAILSGRSLAGALRQRAWRIVQTMRIDPSIVEDVFGTLPSAGRSPKPAELKASRLSVAEAPLKNAKVISVSRVSLDPFSGGARDTALYDESVVINANCTLTLTLIDPQEREIGLLLLVLRDLAEEDLPIGGTVGVGRGRMTGKVQLATKDRLFTLNQDNNYLQTYVDALYTKGFGEVKHEAGV